MAAIKGLTGIGKCGEGVFQRYLDNRKIPYEYEPALEGTTRLIDFVLSPPGQEKIHIDVKTIYKEPPRSSGVLQPYTSQGDSSAITETFIRKDGMMLRGDGPRNSRLCALISVHSADRYAPDFMAKQITMAEAATLFAERTKEPEFAAPYVTVWDNAAGKRSFPTGLFEGSMDARWSYNGKEQFQAFVGKERRALQLEGLERGRTIY